jgi:hypothetical protein
MMMGVEVVEEGERREGRRIFFFARKVFNLRLHIITFMVILSSLSPPLPLSSSPSLQTSKALYFYQLLPHSKKLVYPRISTMTRNKALSLYKSILRAHSKYLPMEMRQLGDAYVKSEVSEPFLP